ncbi:MAG TPA: ribose 5-phosphate isomerase B [candidate division Zixibacteria bacterium]|nr:ribose 5-phosphate isomerase B [candidate division Zixibacteria bacterium]
MKIAVASDHAGLEFKEEVKGILERMGHEVIDVGTYTKDSCDYPDFGLAAARMVARGEADRAVTICWTGNGMNMVANKVKGIRAGLALNPEMAFLTRSHNDANVLTLSQKYTPENQLEEILEKFLTTEFEGGRHQRRIDKMMAVEQ